MARAENRSTPKVLGSVLYGDQESMSVGTPGWYQWLLRGETFYYEDNRGTFTARCELRSGGQYWYAYRRQAGRLSKRYLGKSDELALNRLAAIAVELAFATSNKALA